MLSNSKPMPMDPDGAIGSSGGGNRQQQQRRGSRRVTWDLLFASFLVLAGVACGLAVLTGSYVLPGTHEVHEMDHSKNHPSFEAPGKTLREQRRHNLKHMEDFREAYHKRQLVAELRRKPREQRDLQEANGDNLGELEELVATLGDADEDVAEKREEFKAPNQDDTTMDGEGQAHHHQHQKYHMVFSTSCSGFQNWQALAFFYFARKVRQPGTVTRLVAGCTDEQATALKKVHETKVVPLAIEGVQEFQMHVTPNFDDSKGGDQKYFNKPNSLLHWMEGSLGFQNDGSAHAEDDSIVIIVDPDMMLLRPITKDFSSRNYGGGWVEPPNTKKHAEDNDPVVDYDHDVVTHGRPHAQKYGYGAAWLEALGKHVRDVVGVDSPALKTSRADAADYYPAGPPYVATARDMYQIAVHWVKFLPKYHTYFSGMMCEMHSYSLAAAHLELPHKLANGFMVSNQEADENFQFIDDKMELKDVCMDPPVLKPAGIPLDPADSRTAMDQAYEDLGIPIRDLPYVLHYCQRYALGRYFFSKYKLPEDTFEDCDAPMMIEPPRNVADIYDWNMFPNGIEHRDFARDPDAGAFAERMKPRWRKRNGWLLCAVVYGMNEAIAAYKTASCGTDARYFRKTFHFHEEEAFRKALEDPTNPFQKKKREERD